MSLGTTVEELIAAPPVRMELEISAFSIHRDGKPLSKADAALLMRLLQIHYFPDHHVRGPRTP